ncbi:hypothetical protein TRICI_002202 [Trichomonascus ciferrii]|uniref:AD domain-containing protein n=1 Tax=Trichomonascus ciferrii TaxID=44093 RepID=A0A642VC65_9ASCO|nr:hypothetical protein TRICI_002202 [Trichomonascus ciferrii]
MNSLDWVVGLRVYSFCQITNTITLAEDQPQEAGGKKQKQAAGSDYRVIKTSFIKDVAVLDKPKGVNKGGNLSKAFGNMEPSIGAVSINAARKREQEAVKKARELRVTQGVGVTREGQMIFDAIYKTLPCRWHEKSIIVFDEVRVDPPYTTNTCIADNPNSSALELVKKIVQGTQDKFANELKGG